MTKQNRNKSEMNSILIRNSTILSFFKRNKIIILFGNLMVLTLILLLLATDMRRDTSRIEFFFFIPFAIYVGTIFWILKTNKQDYMEYKNKIDKKQRLKELIIIIIFFAIIFRVIFLFTEPTLSDDIYRFYWEGKITNQGINPFIHAPDSEELEQFRDSDWEKVHNKYNPTCYPPVSQIAFSISYFISPSIYSIKIFFTLFDILSIYIIFLILKNFKFDPRYTIIYAWSPLVIIEFAHSGHNDSLAIFFTLLSFLFLQKDNKKLSSIALAMAFLTKFYPIILVPLFLKKWGKKNTAIFFLTVCLFYLPFISAGHDLAKGMIIYIEDWLFNGSIFPFLIEIVKFFNFTNDPIIIAKIFIFIFFGLVLFYFTLKTIKYNSNTLEILKFSFILIGLFIILNPTVHPWYIIWIIPFLCFFKSKSWILLTGTVVLSYYIYIDFDNLGIWSEKWWIRVIEYLPFYVLLFYEIMKNRNLFRINRINAVNKKELMSDI